MSYDPFADDVFGGAEKTPAVSFKDAPIGTVVTMVVSKAPELVQSRDYQTGEKATWPDGNPKMSVVVTGEVDGEAKSLWAPKPSALFTALHEAQKKADARLAPGGVLKVKLTGEKPNENPRLNPQKLYAAIYEPAAAPDPFESMPATASTPVGGTASGASSSFDEPPF